MKNLLLLLLFISSNALSQTDSAKRNTIIAAQLPRILIINTFDTKATNYRKNKKQLFGELTDSLKSLLAEQIRMRNLGEPIIIAELLPAIFDSKATLDSLFTLYGATYTIVIKDLNAFFEQTKVEVSRNDFDGSKKREASYSICSDVNYALYKKDDKPYHSVTKLCDPFTTRNVMSGLLAGGPDIVGKSKHAFRAIEKNGELFISNIVDRLK